MLKIYGVYPVKRVIEGITCLMLVMLPLGNSSAEGVREARPLIQGEEWLHNQTLSHFTLQLLATRDSAGLIRFAQQQKFAGPLVHFVVEHQGKEMHLLAQGSYATRAEAVRAAKKLPQGIRPWIRTLASIQRVAMTKEKPVEKPLPVVPIDEGGVKGLAWLWSQDPQAYTIQLAGAKSRDAIDVIMRQLDLPGEKMVVRTQDSSGPRYSLIYGSFAEEASARATIARLPESLQQAKPWPRRFANLHDEISRATP